MSSYQRDVDDVLAALGLDRTAAGPYERGAVEAVLDELYETGYAEGYKQGYGEGYTEAEVDVYNAAQSSASPS